MKPWQRLTDIIGDHNIIDEMSKKYKNTVLGVTDPTAKMYKPSYGWYVGISNDGAYHKMRNKNGDSYQLSVDTEYEVFIPDPPRGMYNTSHGVAQFYRKPFRQHKRGLGEGTAQIQMLSSVIIPEMGGNYLEQLVFDVLEEADVNEKFSLSENRTWELIHNKGEIALDRTFVVALHAHKAEGYQLYYETHLIGEVTKDKILLGNPAFLQEVLDTRKTWCPNHTVEVM